MPSALAVALINLLIQVFILLPLHSSQLELPATELTVEKVFSHLLITSQSTEISCSPSIPSKFINTRGLHRQISTERWGKVL
jgi:hypothetical protein